VNERREGVNASLTLPGHALLPGTPTSAVCVSGTSYVCVNSVLLSVLECSLGPAMAPQDLGDGLD
jgi:hypothetical protein